LAWDYQQTITGSAPLVLPVNFSSSLLAIELTIANQPDTWFKAGYLQIFVEVEGIACLGRRLTLWFGGQLVEVPYASYQLQFQAVQWSELTTIKIKELSNPEIKTIMPLYTGAQEFSGELPIIDSLPTSFTALGYVASNPPLTYQALPANPARQKFAVTNLGNGAVYLDLDAPTANAKRFITIAGNGTYVSDLPYIGAVFVWSANNTAQNCEIREFIQ
jgi:hypothetical protein